MRTSALLGAAPSEDHEGSINPRLAEVERALCTYRSLALSDVGQLPPLEELAAQISAARQSWFTSPTKYSDVLRVLPRLIVHSELAVHASGRSRQACQQAYEVNYLATGVLKFLGRLGSCRLVSERAMRYAEATEDPLLIAAATWNLGFFVVPGVRQPQHTHRLIRLPGVVPPLAPGDTLADRDPCAVRPSVPSGICPAILGHELRTD